MSIGQSERGHSSIVVPSSQMTSLCQGTDATHIHVCIYMHPHTHSHTLVSTDINTHKGMVRLPFPQLLCLDVVTE